MTNPFPDTPLNRICSIAHEVRRGRTSEGDFVIRVNEIIMEEYDRGFNEGVNRLAKNIAKSKGAA